MAVLDASALVEYLAGGEHSEQVRERILSERQSLWAPHLIDAEIGHVLRRAVAIGEVGTARARRALDTLASMPLRRAEHRPLLPRAWQLRANSTFYDALYIALAERLATSLVTLDARTATVPGVRAPVEVVTD